MYRIKKDGDQWRFLRTCNLFLIIYLVLKTTKSETPFKLEL